MASSELALVRWLEERFRADPVRVPIGIGDDAAALRLDGSLIVVTADMLLDGVHFDSASQEWGLIGRKAIACSLSDCAAMGCRPRGATVSIALPQGITLEAIKALYEGMAGIAEEYGCAIIGGDTTSWPGKLAIDVAMLAEPMAQRGPVRRSEARPGDTLYVSGTLGGSILGKHLTFVPRLELAERLVRHAGLHAMMDLSDGISLDLNRMCAASGCDAELSEPQCSNAISQAARTLAAADGRSALDRALSDGEDFELLVAGDEELGRAVPELIPVGRIIPRAGESSAVTLVYSDGRREPVQPAGYQHGF